MKKLLITISIVILIIIMYLLLIPKYNYVVTYCNNDYGCNIENVKSNEQSLKNKYKKYYYLKLDKIINKKDVSSKELSNIIISNGNYEFKYGINFNDKISLLSEEINSNSIIDYEKKEINITNLNNYIKNKNIIINSDDLNKISIFSTESKLLLDNKEYSLSLKNGFNIRNSEDINLSEVIDNSFKRLKSMIKEDGSFIYGYRANTGKEINDYNILRHSGSIYSLIKYYEYNNNEDLKSIINKAIEYLINNKYIKYSNNKAYIVEKKANEIKLGGNALTLLALSEYQIAFNDNRYYSIAKKLADGILSFQRKDNLFNHVLNIDLTLKSKYRTVYYDGEATFSLLKFYKISNDKKYYNAVSKVIDMFIKKNYTKYGDQWIGYTMNEYLKYNKKEKYIKFTLDNYTNNNYDNITDFKPIKLELLMNILNTYNYLINNNINSNSLDSFNIDKLNQSINYLKNILLNYYINDEYVIYFDNPKIIKYGFMSIGNNFRMRIDDIQHSLSGLILYKEMKG